MADCVTATKPPAMMTPILPMASLREHSQTERTLLSPSRQRNKITTENRLAANARKPTQPIVEASGGVASKKLIAVEINTKMAIADRESPLSKAARALMIKAEPITARLIA